MVEEKRKKLNGKKDEWEISNLKELT